MRHKHLGQAFAAVSAALVSLGGADPERVAAALHGGTCWECLTGDGDCDGRPSDDDRAFAHAFAQTLEVFSELAAPSFRAFDGNQG
jgi:hypothetical protein